VSSVFSTAPQQQYEYAAVLIDDVDIEVMQAHARDRTGAIIQCSYRDQPAGLMAIPAPGERWIAIRKGYTWYLESRMATPEEMAGLQQGDLSIDAPGDIYIQGKKLSAIGGNVVQDFVEHPLVGDGGFATAVLTHAPLGASSITVFLNGLLLWPDLWTYDDATKTITFDATMGEIGALLVRYETADEVS